MKHQVVCADSKLFQTMGTCCAIVLSAMFARVVWAQTETQPGGNTPPAANAQPAEEEDESTGLPPDYRPPGETLAIMEMEKRMLEPDEVESMGKSALISREFPRALLSGNVDAKTKQTVSEGIRYRIFEWTLKENHPNVHELRKNFMNQFLRRAGALNAQQRVQFREFVMGEVTERAKELLDNNFYVRLQAVILLGELNLVDEDKRNSVPAVAHTPAANVLLEVIVDDAQPEAIKLHAAKGLKRIAEEGRPNDNFRVQIADELIKELNKESTHYWYQMRLTEALAAMDVVVHPLNGTPFLIDALTKIMSDPKRHWIVRCQAAHSLGRVRVLPKNAGVQPAALDLGGVARKIADLAREMADAYNQDPAAYYWKNCYLKLYLAFQPIDSAERTRKYGLLPRGELSQFSTQQPLMTESYQNVVLPLARHVLKSNPPAQVPKALLDQVDAWLNANKAVAAAN